MRTLVLVIITMCFPARVVLSDTDGDSYPDVREMVAGCNVWDAASFPVCVDLDGDGIGETTPIAPLCAIVAPGFAPCA